MAQGIITGLPAPGTIISLSAPYAPAVIKGIKIYNDDAFKIDFIIHPGDDTLTGRVFEEESNKLVRYFLAALTTPENELWVNLSPHEANRIIPEGLSGTEMGAALLAQDYLLKQITASLMYPEEDLGQHFWERVYQEAKKKLGTTEIPLNTFNKVWIIPRDVSIFETKDGAFITSSHLQVLMEEDYLSVQQAAVNLEPSSTSPRTSHADRAKPIAQSPQAAAAVKSIIKEIIIPELEKEVNEGKNFASLRQITNSVIFAAWFKQKIKEAARNDTKAHPFSTYIDRHKIRGIESTTPRAKEDIYNQYLEAFKKGVYDYIKEEYDPTQQTLIPRHYFSGGLNFKTGRIPASRTVSESDQGQLAESSVITVNLQNTKLNHAQVRLPVALRQIINHLDEVTAQGSTVEEILIDLIRQFPDLNAKLLAEGKIHPAIKVFVNSEPAGLDFPVTSRAEVDIITSVAGGMDIEVPASPLMYHKSIETYALKMRKLVSDEQSFTQNFIISSNSPWVNYWIHINATSDVYTAAAARLSREAGEYSAELKSYVDNTIIVDVNNARNGEPWIKLLHRFNQDSFDEWTLIEMQDAFLKTLFQGLIKNMNEPRQFDLLKDYLPERITPDVVGMTRVWKELKKLWGRKDISNLFSHLTKQQSLEEVFISSALQFYGSNLFLMSARKIAQFPDAFSLMVPILEKVHAHIREIGVHASPQDQALVPFVDNVIMIEYTAKLFEEYAQSEDDAKFEELEWVIAGAIDPWIYPDTGYVSPLVFPAYSENSEMFVHATRKQLMGEIEKVANLSGRHRQRIVQLFEKVLNRDWTATEREAPWMVNAKDQVTEEEREKLYKNQIREDINALSKPLTVVNLNAESSITTLRFQHPNNKSQREKTEKEHLDYYASLQSNSNNFLTSHRAAKESLIEIIKRIKNTREERMAKSLPTESIVSSELNPVEELLSEGNLYHLHFIKEGEEFLPAHLQTAGKGIFVKLVITHDDQLEINDIFIDLENYSNQLFSVMEVLDVSIENEELSLQEAREIISLMQEEIAVYIKSQTDLSNQLMKQMRLENYKGDLIYAASIPQRRERIYLTNSNKKEIITSKGIEYVLHENFPVFKFRHSFFNKHIPNPQRKETVGINAASDSAQITSNPPQSLKETSDVLSVNSADTKGGIDLNSGFMNIQRDSKGEMFTMPTMNSVFDIEGLIPVIIQVIPVTNVLQLLGLKDEDEEEKHFESKLMVYKVYTK